MNWILIVTESGRIITSTNNKEAPDIENNDGSLKWVAWGMPVPGDDGEWYYNSDNMQIINSDGDIWTSEIED